MRISFPILAALWVMAAGVAAFGQRPALTQPPVTAAIVEPAPATAAGQGGVGAELAPQAEQARELIGRALSALETHRAIRAQLRFNARALGQDMLGSGLYLQGPVEEHRYRLELKLQVSGEAASLLHVCDGQTLWIRQQLLSDPSIMKVDVAATLFALATRRQTAGHPAFPRTPSIGGLPRLIREIDESFDLSCLGRAELGSLSLWVLSGRWTPERLTAAAPDAAKAAAAGEEDIDLPPQLPTHVLLCLGANDFFPYRIEYRRAPNQLGRLAKELDDPATQMLRLEFFKVAINPALDPNQFVYNPGDLPVADFTEAYQQQLGVAPVE